MKQMKKEADGDGDTTGLCDPDNKTIFIRKDAVMYSVIAHEIYHAYRSYLYLEDTNNVSVKDNEEIAASHFAAEGPEMVKKSKKITKELQQLLEKNGEVNE